LVVCVYYYFFKKKKPPLPDGIVAITEEIKVLHLKRVLKVTLESTVKFGMLNGTALRKEEEKFLLIFSFL
jgi:hypothetical protein